MVKEKPAEGVSTFDIIAWEVPRIGPRGAAMSNVET
jgi:hypothetical protein